MAKETVGLEVDVQYNTVGNMKKELRAATNELIQMNEKFGSSSKQATEAAKRVANLKDAIGDAKALADTFNPDKKFVALGGAVQGAVSGFSALQGAMGLFGSESKDVEKMLLKVQSAMALQQGISGIFGSIDAFGQLAGKIKNQVVAAFTTLRGAMMATGIGLITSAVAFLVTNFDAVKNKLGELFPALKGAGDLMDRLKQIAMGVGNALLQFLAAPISALIKVFKGDFSGAFEAVKNGMSFVKNFREGEQKEIKSQADEREKIRQEELKKKKEHDAKLLEQQRATAEKLRQERIAAEQQYTQWLAAERERQLKLTMSDFEKEVFEFKKKYNEQYAIAKKYGFDIAQLEQLRFAESVKIINKETTTSKKSLDERLGDFKSQVPKRATYDAKITANASHESEIRKRISEDEMNSTIQQVEVYFNAAKSISSILRQSNQNQIASLEEQSQIRIRAAGDNKNAVLAIENETAIQKARLQNKQIAREKAMAILEATINTFKAAAQVFARPAPGDPVTSLGTKIAGLVATIATGIANVASIRKVRVPEGGNGPNIDTKAPMTPTLSPTVQTNVQNAQAINQMSSQSTRAYVLNSDIQNEQQRNAYLQRNASI